MAIPILPILAGAGLLGKVLGNAGGSVRDSRIQDNNQRLQQAQIQNQDAINRAQLEMRQREFQQQEPGTQARQAMAGSMLQRLQPLQMSGLSDRVRARMPQMNSIIDAIGPEARNAGAMLAQRGQSGLQSGPTQFSALPPPAQMAALQKSGLLEKLLGAGGLVGSIAGTVGQLGDFGSNTSGNGLPIDPYGGG